MACAQNWEQEFGDMVDHLAGLVMKCVYDRKCAVKGIYKGEIGIALIRSSAGTPNVPHDAIIVANALIRRRLGIDPRMIDR